MRSLIKLSLLFSVALLAMQGVAQAAPTPVTCRPQFGGSGGSGYFTGWSDGFLSRIEVKWGSYVDSVSFTWCKDVPGQTICTTKKVGGSGGSNTGTFDIDWRGGERVIMFDGRSGSFVDSVQFMTNWSRLSPLFGGPGGSNFGIIATGSNFFNDFFGTAGAFIDSMGACEVQ
jgi:hypothetical protein